MTSTKFVCQMYIFNVQIFDSGSQIEDRGEEKGNLEDIKSLLNLSHLPEMALFCIEV